MNSTVAIDQNAINILLYLIPSILSLLYSTVVSTFICFVVIKINYYSLPNIVTQNGDEVIAAIRTIFKVDEMRQNGITDSEILKEIREKSVSNVIAEKIPKNKRLQDKIIFTPTI